MSAVELSFAFDALAVMCLVAGLLVGIRLQKYGAGILLSAAATVFGYTGFGIGLAAAFYKG